MGWPALLDAFIEVEGKGQSPADSREQDELAIARYRLKMARDTAFRTRIRIWVNRTSMDHLISWKAPTREEFLDSDSDSEPAMDVDNDRQRWLVDRFAQTYLQDWSLDSLKLEWRYQHGLEEAPCPLQEMKTRSVDENDLARALAEAAATPVSDIDRVLVATALRLLSEGSRNAAAVMFDEARHAQWNNAEFHNNYGFCILPDDPAESIKALELAGSLGYVRTVNICNRMLALSMIGKNAAALEVADRAIDRWETLDTDPSILWDINISNPELDRQECPRCYILKLAVHISKESGDEAEAVRWRTRAARLAPNLL
jgi:Tfp pilus assembly protein PilF